MLQRHFGSLQEAPAPNYEEICFRDEGLSSDSDSALEDVLGSKPASSSAVKQEH